MYTPYYDEMLVSNGWKEYQEKIGEHLTCYYHSTACVDITTYKGDYRIKVFHDILGQEFSPKLPPMWLISLHEFGETTIARCPSVPGP